MMTDPIADMLTRIRNANRIELPFVDIPATRLKVAVAQVMKVVAPTWFVQLAPLVAEDSSMARVREEAKVASQERLKREAEQQADTNGRRRP